MEKVRFGVIGIGNMGTSHSGWLVGNRIEGAELTAVCDIDEKRREWAKENLPGTVTVYDDYKKLLDSGKIDAVIIAVPHYLHPDVFLLLHSSYGSGIHKLLPVSLPLYGYFSLMLRLPFPDVNNEAQQ